MDNFTDIRPQNLFYLKQDPRTETWPLIDQPAYVLATLMVYMIFVKKLGPAIMKHRDALQLKTFMMFYNVIQIVCCGLLVIFALQPLLQFTPTCVRLSFSDDVIFPRLAYAFFWLKIVDLLDTVIFVLRKKHNQITFLHTFHHVYAVLVGYMHTKYLASTQVALLCVLNGSVHVLMYYYYMKTSLTKETLWWKKYLTSFQLVQLAILASCMIPTLVRPTCKFPKLPVMYIMLMPTLVLILEFSKFYLKSYQSKSKQH